MHGWLRDLSARGESVDGAEGEELRLVWPVLQEAANEFLQAFGEAFTKLPNGHIETDIAGAAAMAGTALREEASSEVVGGSGVTAAEVQARQAELVRFMIIVARNSGLRVTGWNGEVPIDHQPLMPVPELVANCRDAFDAACTAHGVPANYRAHVAALAAMKLVGGGNQVGVLDQSVGTSIAVHYLLAASA